MLQNSTSLYALKLIGELCFKLADNKDLTTEDKNFYIGYLKAIEEILK